MDEYIKSDLFRYTGKVSFTTALKQFLVNRAFRVQVFIRASNRGGIRQNCEVFLLRESLLLPEYTN